MVILIPISYFDFMTSLMHVTRHKCELTSSHKSSISITIQK